MFAPSHPSQQSFLRADLNRAGVSILLPEYFSAKNAMGFLKTLTINPVLNPIGYLEGMSSTAAETSKFLDSTYHGYEAVKGTGYHLYITSDGQQFNLQGLPGRNHGITNLSRDNEFVTGYIITPDNQRKDFKDAVFNRILNDFLNNRGYFKEK